MTSTAVEDGPSAAAVPLRFEPYESTTGIPNVVVDGSPNPSTVLTLTHWPGYPTPDGLERDLSAQMAFAYLDRGSDLHDPTFCADSGPKSP